MSGRLVLLMAGVTLAPLAGCAHHRVGRPPSGDEIAEINQLAGSEGPALTLDYLTVGGEGCGGGICGLTGPLVTPDARPFEVTRVVSADDKQLTVATTSGQVRQVDLNLLRGVTAHNRTHNAFTYAVGGGVLGVGAAGIGLGGYYAVAWWLHHADSFLSSSSYGPGLGPAIGLTAVGIVVGAVAGALIGYDVVPDQHFEFGASPPAPPPISP